MKSGEDVRKTFHKVREKFGLSIKKMGKGDHVVVHSKICRNFSVPLHEELKRGLLLGIIGDAGMTKEEFIQYDP